MRFFATILALIAITPSVQAGAWPRDVGTTFLSFGSTIQLQNSQNSAGMDPTYSLYVEHGLKRELTLGFDFSGKSHVDYQAIAFVRAPVFKGSEQNKFAVQLGAGVTASAGANELILQGGFSWGRGMMTGIGAGWASVDTQVIYFANGGNTAAKADLTLGLKPAQKLKLMMQFQTGAYPGSDPYVRIAPSATWELKPGRHIELGAQIGVINDDNLGAKIGTWLEF